MPDTLISASLTQSGWPETQQTPPWLDPDLAGVRGDRFIGEVSQVLMHSAGEVDLLDTLSYSRSAISESRGLLPPGKPASCTCPSCCRKKKKKEFCKNKFPLAFENHFCYPSSLIKIYHSNFRIALHARKVKCLPLFLLFAFWEWFHE